MFFGEIKNHYVKAMSLLLQSFEENLYNPFALVNRTEQKIIYASTSMLNVFKESLNTESEDSLQIKAEAEQRFLSLYEERYASVNTLLEQLPEKDWSVVRFGMEIGTRSIGKREIVYIVSATKVEIPNADGCEYVLLSLSLASNNPHHRIAVCIKNARGERRYFVKLVNGSEWEEYNKQRLTPTEVHVLLMSGYGMTMDEMSTIMSCSKNTIKTHRSHIMEKLSAKGMVEALVSAMNWKSFFNGK